jgi:hypothetical protein
VELGDKRRGKRTIILKGEGGLEQEHLVPQGKNLRVHRGDHVKAGEALVDGPLVPHDILDIQGEKAVQGYLLREVQTVYRAQGVSIDDKHIEIIVAQMMRKVQVEDPGDSEFLPGAVVDKFRFREANKRLRQERKKPATSSPLLLGITKASLQSDSFISAASFQETTKVLTEAALAGKSDQLVGLKENVILGHLVPTGTGFREYQKTRVRKNIDLHAAAEELGQVGQPSGQVPFSGATQTGGPLGPPGMVQHRVPGPQHSSLQHCSPLSHCVPESQAGSSHVPLSQYGKLPVQARAHWPQFLTSFDVLTQRPPQQVKPWEGQSSVQA